MNNFETLFSKNDTAVMKGIAIIFLLIHHVFSSDLLKLYSVTWYPFNDIFGMAWLQFAGLAKICVSIFAFLSGYGLCLSCKKIDFNKKEDLKIWYINRTFSLFGRYWFIFIFLFLSGFVLNEVISLENPISIQWFFMNGKLPALFYIGIDFFALSTYFNTPCLIGPSWYMGAALFFLLLTPLLVRLIRTIGSITVIILLVITPQALGMAFTGTNSPFPFLLIFTLGMICAENNLLVERIYKKRNKCTKFIVYSLCILICSKLYLVLDYKLLYFFHWGLYPFFIIYYINEFLLNLPIIRNILIFLGKHSGNIFLLHITLLLNYETKWIYYFHNFIIDFFILLISSLIFSIFINFLVKITKYNVLLDKIRLWIVVKITNETF